MDTAVTMKTFPELLEEAQDYLRQRLSDHRPDAADPNGESMSFPDILEQTERGMAKAAEVRRQLFEVGHHHGITEREVTVLLMRKLVSLVRPGSMRRGCSCPSCLQRRRDEVTGG